MSSVFDTKIYPRTSWRCRRVTGKWESVSKARHRVLWVWDRVRLDGKLDGEVVSEWQRSRDGDCSIAGDRIEDNSGNGL